MKAVISFAIFICMITVLFLTDLVWINNYTQPSRFPQIRVQPTNWTNPYDLNSLGLNDFSSLIDLTDFRFILNNERCAVKSNEKEVFLVIFVHSAPANFEKRKSIRSTWGSENNLVHESMKIVFLVGQVLDSPLQKQLLLENEQNHDLIQGNFIDSYRNLTYKHLMGLKWVVYFCQNAKYVFKTDDDIFVDIFQLSYYLKGNFGTDHPPSNLISCYVIKNPYPKRSQRSKWRVTFKEYPNKYYPEYCSGWGILMSPDVVFKLYRQSRKTSYFWVDDVLVSGLLAKRVGLKHVDFSPKLALGDDDIEGWLTNDELTMPPLFGHPDSDVSTIYKLWNKTVKYYRVKYKLNHLE